MALLRIGSKDPEIGRIKRQLEKQGHWNACNGFSDSFGKKLFDAVIYFQQTHFLGDGSRPGIDGIIGNQVRWMLKNPTAKSPALNRIARIPKGLTEIRHEILRVALSQVGTKEIPNGSNRGKKPNGGVDKYLPAWGKTKKGPPWCCFFVSWVTKQAFGKYPLGQNAGLCAWAYDKARKLGMLRLNNGKNIPVPGDAFVMLYKKGGKFTGKGHIGFVFWVSKDGQTIITLEGNCLNQVLVGQRELSDKSIVGFIDFAKDSRKCKGFERGTLKARKVGKAGTR